MINLRIILIIVGAWLVASAAFAQEGFLADQVTQVLTDERVACLQYVAPQGREPSFEELQRFFVCFRGTPIEAFERGFNPASAQCLKQRLGGERFTTLFTLESEPSTSEQLAIARCVAGGRAVVRAVIDNPRVEEINETRAAPAAAAIAAANTAVAVPFGNLFAFLRYLLTQPLLLLERRKRKGWGIVYHALTKVPLDLAVVRLQDAKTGGLLRTRVTDRHGRYAFVVEEGGYKVEVAKSGFVFPSAALARRAEDAPYADLYLGQAITIGKAGDTIRGSIPLDPHVKDKVSAGTGRRFVSKLNRLIAGLSILFAFASFAVSPKWWVGILVFFHVTLYLAMRRLALKRRPKGYGVVHDQKTQRPIRHAIVRIFRADYDKLAETYVTDRHGRYVFLVGPGEFYLTVEASGYVLLKSPLYRFKDSTAPAAITASLDLVRSAKA